LYFAFISFAVSAIARGIQLLFRKKDIVLAVILGFHVHSLLWKRRLAERMPDLWIEQGTFLSRRNPHSREVVQFKGLNQHQTHPFLRGTITWLRAAGVSP
jgi:hypothetical protein